MCTKPHSCLSRDDKRVVVVVGGVIAFSLFSLIFLDSFLLLLALCVCIYRDFTCPVLFSYSRPFGFDSFSLCFWCFSLTWSLVQFCVYWYKISTTWIWWFWALFLQILAKWGFGFWVLVKVHVLILFNWVWTQKSCSAKLKLTQIGCSWTVIYANGKRNEGFVSFGHGVYAM